jgi:hypothetical protein
MNHPEIDRPPIQEVDQLLTEVFFDTSDLNDRLHTLASISLPVARLVVRAEADASWPEVLQAASGEMPLGSIYTEASRLSQERGDFLPFLEMTQLESKTTPSPLTDLENAIPIERPLTPGFSLIARAYQHAKTQIREETGRSDIVDEEIIPRAADWLARAAEFKPRDGELDDALAWAQLGTTARMLLLDLRETKPNRHINYERFLGHAEDEGHTDLLFTMRALATAPYPEEDRVKEMRQFLLQFPNATTGMLTTDEAVYRYFNALEPMVFEDFIKHGTPVGHALYLDEAMRLRHREEAPGTPPRLAPIDWLNDAPFDLIRDVASKMGPRVDQNDRLIVLANAVQQYIFGDREDDPELRNWILMQKLGTIQYMAPFCREMSKVTNATPQTIYHVGMAVNFKEHEAKRLLTEGYEMSTIADNYWLATMASHAPRETLYPATSPALIKQRWLCDNVYDYLPNGWNRATVGKILATRLAVFEKENPCITLAEISDCLPAIAMPERAYIPGSDVPEQLRDVALERSFLRTLLHLESVRAEELRLPQKPQVIEQLFDDPIHRFLYEALLGSAGEDELLSGYIDTHIDEFYEHLVDGSINTTTVRLSHSNFIRNVHTELRILMSGLQESSDVPLAGEVSHYIGQLRQIGRNRKAYMDDAGTWLLRNASMPVDKLTVAWEHRHAAISDGSPDTVGAIIDWHIRNEEQRLNLPPLRFYESTLTTEELQERFPAWLTALSPYCSKDDALEILRTTAAGINYEALLPAMNVSFSEVESVDGEAYYGEILAKDDPHGTYIGNETACCMRYDSWAPEAFTCIQAAYRWPNTGLFALYGSDGGIDAQSFFWKHPEHPNTLVLDSAEPLEGRQPERLRERYIQFWRRTLIEHAARDKSFPIRRVHIGGYDRMPLDGLQPTESIPALPGLYTDAETQLLLVEVTDEEIEAAIVEGPAFLNEVLERPHVTRIPTLSVKGNERLVVEMENRAYSPAQRGYGTPNDVKELMTLRSGADYSFISVDDDSKARGLSL